jgi:hypothetical protein
MRKRLREGTLDDKEIEIEVAEPSRARDPGPAGHGRDGRAAQGPVLADGPGQAQDPQAEDRRGAEAAGRRRGRQAGQRGRDPQRCAGPCRGNGIVFIDEIDKVASRSEHGGADVSRQGVQRDLLPLVEGTTVNTKYGIVKTDHILFIASGAFHLAKPSDLIPELQGRFPIRVELGSLSVDDFEAILTSTQASLVTQYQALLATEGVTLEHHARGVRRLAQIACDVNERTENIGARRLATVMERLLDEVSFDAPNRGGQTVVIDAAAVDAAGRAGEERRPVALHPVAPRLLRWDCSNSRPSKISVSTVSKGRSVIGRQLDGGAAGHQQQGAPGRCAPAGAVHALDGAGDRVARRRSSAHRWCWWGSPPPRRWAPSGRRCPSPAP